MDTNEALQGETGNSVASPVDESGNDSEPFSLRQDRNDDDTTDDDSDLSFADSLSSIFSLSSLYSNCVEDSDDDLSPKAASNEVTEDDLHFDSPFSHEFSADIMRVLQQRWVAVLQSQGAPVKQSLAVEFVNVEMFWINMDALLLEILSHDYLDWTWGGQSLVVVYMIERFLDSLLHKDGRFKLVFFDDLKELYHQAGPEIGLIYEIVRTHVISQDCLRQLCLIVRNAYSADFFQSIRDCHPSFIFTSSRVYPIQGILEEMSARRFEVCFASIYLQCRCRNIPVADLCGVVQGLSSVMAFYSSKTYITKLESRLLCTLKLAWVDLGLNIRFDISNGSLTNQNYNLKGVDHVSIWEEALRTSMGKYPPMASMGAYQKIILGVICQHLVPLNLRCQKVQPLWLDSFADVFYCYLVPILETLSNVVQNITNMSISPPSFYDLIDGRFLLAIFAQCCEMEEHNEMTLPPMIFDSFAATCKSLMIPVKPWVRDTGTDGAAQQWTCSQPPRTAAGEENAAVLFPTTVVCHLITDLKMTLPESVSGLLQTSPTISSVEEIGTPGSGIFPSLYVDHRHWHSGKIIPDPIDFKAHKKRYSGNPRYSQKRKQKSSLADYSYGQSLTSANIFATTPNYGEPHAAMKIVVQETNVSNTTKNTPGRNKHNKSSACYGFRASIKSQIIQQNARKHELTEICQYAKLLTEMDQNLRHGSISSPRAISQIDSLALNVKYAASEIMLMMKAIELAVNILSDGGDEEFLEQKRKKAVDLLLRVRYVYIRNKENLPVKHRQRLCDIWALLGFPLGVLFRDIETLPKLHATKGRSGRLCLEIDWPEYMLRYGGELMDVQNDPQFDKRVPFEPDSWQRQLLDAGDADTSALVVAPTSAGKTFVSYYCIQKILNANTCINKEAELGFVVYVSPTKALANQVAATIYERFSKHSSASGCPVYGVFTRDYTVNLDRCQILVTVPQCLNILLMSPSRERWVRQLRYVILDEIHCIGGSYIEGENDNVWEHIIKMIPCAFLALSATVGNPHHLHQWFTDVENQKLQYGIRSSHGNEHMPSVKLISCSERYTEIHHYLFKPPSGTRPSSEKTARDHTLEHGSRTQRRCKLTRLHPLSAYTTNSLLDYGFPSDNYLTAAETVHLYNAMSYVDSSVDGSLSVTTFAPSSVWLTRSDLRNYEKALKTKLVNWAAGGSNTPLEQDKCGEVISLLSQNNKTQLRLLERPFNSGGFAMRYIVDLVEYLRSNDMLPCLAFGDNRRLCEALAKKVATYLDDQEESFLNQPGNAAIVAEWEKKTERAKKINKKLRDRKLKASSKSRGQVEQIDDMVLTNIVADIPIDLSRFTLVRRGVGSDLFEQQIGHMNDRGEADPFILYCLDRGIGFHHSGMKRSQRQAVEVLFRARYLGIVFTTSTLALGVHMPCRSVTFTCDSMYLTPLKYRQMSGRAGRRGFDKSGNVIFFSLPRRRINRLLTASLPVLRGNTPFTAAIILRLLTICDHAKDKALAASRAKILLGNHFITYAWSGKVAKNFNRQMQLYVLFCSEYLRSMSLVDKEGRPSGLAGVINHLFYHQPGCFAFVYFLQQGVFHSFCHKYLSSLGKNEVMKTIVLVMAHLFTSRPLPHGYSALKRRKNSKGFLEPLPECFAHALNNYNSFVNNCYMAFLVCLVKSYGSEPFTQTSQLPLSQYPYRCSEAHQLPDHEIAACKFGEGLQRNSLRDSVLGFPLALCGNSTPESFLFQQYLVPPIDERVFMDPSLIPSIPYPLRDHVGREIYLNSYALDFYCHGIWKALVYDNGLMEGDVFHELKDFKLMLGAVHRVMEEIVQDREDIILKLFREISEKYSNKMFHAFRSRSY